MDRESHGIVREALYAYIDLMGKEAYFDAHNALEKAWYPLRKEKTPLGNLLRGLINAAVAFEHIKRATPTAMTKARKVFAGYIKYRHKCDDADCYFKSACKKADEIAKNLEILL